MSITFNANANEDKIVLDTTYLPDPFTYKFMLNIQNQSQQTLYFKISSGNSNWSVTSPSGGKLGSIDSASSKTFVIQMQRSKPTSDIVETVPLTIEAYNDSEYTNKVDQGSINLIAIIGDIRNWENVTIYNFDDGTSQGWTLSGFSISDDASVEAGGYSSRAYYAGRSSFTATMSLTTTLSSNSTVVLSGLFGAKLKGGYNASSFKVYLDYLLIKVNDNVVCKVNLGSSMGYYVTAANTKTMDWAYFGVDLSQYSGQNVTIDITVGGHVYTGGANYNGYIWVWIDDIIIAGTDSL